jgi:hypothetical protein
MDKWEYRTLEIGYDRKTHKDWVVEYAGQPPLVGLGAILAAYGAEGWELVGLGPDRLQAFPAFGRWDVEPHTYRATFKRPVQAQS